MAFDWLGTFAADAKTLAVLDEGPWANDVLMMLSWERQCGYRATGMISHPLSPCFPPYLLRTHPSHPRLRDPKAALTFLTLETPTGLLAALKPHAG
ncbi:hypothetical protein N7451_011099 [Penicillium sp. IBT 35674x]|nr:hypothetical protein N7451_011099 [Penicillium sp. IBT 35674x]